MKNDTKTKFNKLVQSGQSIIIDNTNFRQVTPVRKSRWGYGRDQYLKILQRHSYYIVGLWLKIPMEIANYLNYYRSNYTNPDRGIVPKVVYHTYQKHFFQPELSEGFNQIIIKERVCNLTLNPDMLSFII